jgi:hypothetical protein
MNLLVRWRASLALFWCLTAMAAPAAAQKKTDVVQLVNGDRLTCEIRKLDRGKLTVKTDGMGTVSIEWDDVEWVTSTATYDVELSSGERLFGSLERGDPKQVHVVTASGQEGQPLGEIIRLAPLRGTFWRRLDGSIAAGFNFTQANLETQWTFSGTVSYRSRRWLSEVTADSLLTRREDADSQTRNTLTLETQRYLRPRWSLLAFGQFQQNEELSLNLRAAVGAGVVRILSQSNRTASRLLGGLAFTREQYAGEGDQSFVEAVAGGSFEWFTFDGRSTNLSVGALSFYALHPAGRVRIEVNTSFKSDIVGDLYWSVTAYESYNGDPPEGRKKNDSGVSATVGWTF